MTNRKNPSSIQDTLKAIMGAQRIILCAHLQPDGDTIGSLLAMKALLERLGKEVTAICHDPVPKNLHILNGWEAVQLASECTIDRFDLFCAGLFGFRPPGDALPLLLTRHRSRW